MSEPVVVVMIVQNEDRWLDQAMRNVRAFATEIVIIMDSGSADATEEIARRHADRVVFEEDLRRTHAVIEPYLKWKSGWLFGVDGDELYDPVGLREVRDHIEAGFFRNSFLVMASYLHAEHVGGGMARGYLAPPSWSPSKLFHIPCIEAWPSDGVRTVFNCKTRVLRPGCLELDSRYLDMGWERSPFRCVHARFMARSSKEVGETLGARLCGDDKLRGKLKRNERKVYRLGPIVTVDAQPFVR